MNCPTCQVIMREREKESVIIDVCPRCLGIWLDHGELEKLVVIEREREATQGNRFEEFDEDEFIQRARYSETGGRDEKSSKKYKKSKKRGFLGELLESLIDD